MIKAEPKAPANKHAAKNSRSFFRDEGIVVSEQQPDIQPFFNPYNTEFNNNHSTPFFNSPKIHPKLKVGRPGDKYEQEADHMADNVVQKLNEAETPTVQKKQHTAPSPAYMPQLQQQTAENTEEQDTETEEPLQASPIFESSTPPEENPALQKKCTDCEHSEQDLVQRKCEKCEKEEQLQTKSNGETQGSNRLEKRLSSTKGRGSILPENTRSGMESAFGVDFSSIRVHTGSDAVHMNKELNSQAFTHGNDIYFNSGRYNTNSSTGKHLLAHELTHTIQQGGSQNSIQSKLEEYEQPEHGKNAANRLENLAEENKGEENESGEVDRGEKHSQMREHDDENKPRIDQSAIEVPKTEQEKKEGEEKIENPEPLVPEENQNEEQTTEPPPDPFEAEIQASKVQAASTQQQINGIRPIEPVPEVTTPDPFSPVDAKGEALPADPKGDQLLGQTLMKVQEVRLKGQDLKEKGTEFKAKGLAMESKLHDIKSNVKESEKYTGQLDEAIKNRRDAVVKGEESLTSSNEKVTKFEEESPEYKTRIDENKDDSGAIVNESNQVKEESSSAQPEDGEDRENSEELGGEMNSLNNKNQRVDDTFGEIQTSLDTYIERNNAAKEKNTQSEQKLQVMHQQLDTADAKVSDLQSTNQEALTQIEGRVSQPLEIQNQGTSMDEKGDDLIQTSLELEQRTLAAQQNYENAISSIPGIEIEENQPNEDGGGTIQRQPEGDYGADHRLNLGQDFDLSLINPVTYLESQEERQRQLSRARQARQSELQSIQQDSEQPFSEYSFWQKVGLGLQMIAGRFGTWITSLKIVDGVKFVLNLINPISYILGVASGFVMIINGVYNLFQDILRGDFWGALKSAADICTGIAVIAGSITGLAFLISLAITVAMFFGVGLSLAWIIPIMGKVMAFAGPIALKAGLFGAALNFFAGLKSLYDIGSAESANELQVQVDDLQEDMTNVGINLLMAYAGRAGQRFDPASLFRRSPGRGAGGGGATGGGTGTGSSGVAAGTRPNLTVVPGSGGSSTAPQAFAGTGALKLQPAPRPVFEPVLVPEPVAPPVGASPAPVPTGAGVGSQVGPTVAAGTATQTAASQNKKKKDKEDCEEQGKPYKWVPNNHTVPNGPKVLRYCEDARNNFTKHRHHTWPKFIGGPEAQTLMPVDQNIHLGEYHGNQGPIGGIHTYIENYLNNSRDYRNLLQGNSIERNNTNGTGNQLLINEMRTGGGNNATLRSRIKNKLLEYYRYYRNNSAPQMPSSAYSVGLNDSVNNIV